MRGGRRGWCLAALTTALLLAGGAVGNPPGGSARADATGPETPPMPERRPSLPGIGDAQNRVIVSPLEAPWNALVRVQIPGVAVCTGFVIARAQIVTSAHCLWGRGLEKFVPPSAIHVLGGYSQGQFSGKAMGLAYRMARNFTPTKVSGEDIAVIQLDAPVVEEGVPLRPARAARTGQKVFLGGYNQDRSEVIEADLDCTLLGGVRDSDGLPLLRHDCAGTRGTSGAPLLTREADGSWAVLGVQVAASNGQKGGLAVPITAIMLLAEHPAQAAPPTPTAPDGGAAPR